MRDLLPEEAQQRRALGRRVLDHFALYGYQLVTPPAFEFAEVLERGLGTLDPADVLRFVEPESGEVAALRPDMTPQIARMVASRLTHEPLPMRLCYEGTVVRRRQGRARRHRQIPQAGVELYGIASREGDLEVLELAASVVRAAGLESFVVDLGHAGIARALLDPLPAPLSAELTDALVHKDVTRLEGLLDAGGTTIVPAAVARALVGLGDLAGGGPDDPAAASVFARAEKLLAGTAAEAPLRELAALWQAARARPDGALASSLRVDLGEVRGFAYYTGPIFHVLAPGPGEPIAAGGRYDELLSRFDAPSPAVGFALHLDAVAWAREAAGAFDGPPFRVLCALGHDAPHVAAALRALGIAAAVHGVDADPAGYARSWRFTHVLTAEGGTIRIESAGVLLASAPAGTPAAEIARIVAELPDRSTR